MLAFMWSAPMAADYEHVVREVAACLRSAKTKVA